MRVLLQRVRHASVDVGEERVAQIGPGLLAFVGVFPEDGAEQIKWLADKTLGLRIFADASAATDSMNCSVVDINGELLVVSQFTLAADTSRGRRPGFTSAAAPAFAEKLYNQFVLAVSDRGVGVATGRFGADMQVNLTNDGPATFLLEK